MTDLDVSVVVCTRNRAASLRRMLDSAAEMDIPAGLAWELIVVDNGSTDETLTVIASFADRLPVRGVVEPAPGLSHARNRGVAEARGEMIIWTDDDVAVDRNWLKAYVEAAHAAPDAGFFGGQIVPVLEEPRSELFLQNFFHPALSSLMARREFPASTVEINVDNMPFGANYAIRRAWQKKYLYHPELGVSPVQNRSSEEVNLFYEMLDNGIKGKIVRESIVRHYIASSRQTKKYFRKYYEALGETRAFVKIRGGFAMEKNSVPDGRLVIFGTPYYYWRAAVKSGFKMIVAKCSFNEKGYLESASDYYIRKAYIKYMLSN